jgi:hypothetical protein
MLNLDELLIVCFSLACYVGGMVGIANYCYFAILTGRNSVPVHPTRNQLFRDSQTILSAAIVPQVLVLGFPWFFPINNEMPMWVGHFMIMTTIVMMVLWVWGHVSLVRAGSPPGLGWINRRVVLTLGAPFLLALTAPLGYLLHRW